MSVKNVLGCSVLAVVASLGLGSVALAEGEVVEFAYAKCGGDSAKSYLNIVAKKVNGSWVAQSLKGNLLHTANANEFRIAINADIVGMPRTLADEFGDDAHTYVFPARDGAVVTYRSLMSDEGNVQVLLAGVALSWPHRDDSYISIFYKKSEDGKLQSAAFSNCTYSQDNKFLATSFVRGTEDNAKLMRQSN